MKKAFYILLFTSLLACNKDIVKGTAVSFYPDLVDRVTEGGSSSATLELTGPGVGKVIVSVSNSEFITTDPAMVDGKIELVFEGGVTQQSIDINVARGGNGEDYVSTFSVESFTHDIKGVGSGEFKLFVNAIPSLTLPVFHDFDDCTTDYAIPDGFIEENVPGSKTDRGWGCRADGTNASRAVRASSFGGEAGTDNAWLITNGSLDLTSLSEAYLTFDLKSHYSGDGDLYVKWSEDYSGAGDPTQATWQDVPGVSSQLPSKGSNSFKNIKSDLTSLVGKKIFIAFQFVGGSDASSASYELDNFSISDDGSGFEFFTLPFSDDLNSCSDFNVPANFIQVRTDGSKQDRGWACGGNGTSGSQAVSATALGGVDGTVDAWLISAKAFDLSSITKGNLSFDIRSSTSGSGELKILWSSDYTGSGSTGAANWLEFTGFDLPTGGSNLYQTVEVNLEDAIGKEAYIAFQYVGATNSSAVTYDLDNISVAETTGGNGGSDLTDPGNCDLTGVGTVIVSHDFEGCTTDYEVPSGFIEVNLPGSKTDRGWGCRADGTDDSRAVRASAFGGTEGYDNAWLIMDAIDVSSYTEISVTFDVTSIYDGPGDMYVLYSNDYSGSGDPTGSTWVQLENVGDQLPAKGSDSYKTITTSPCNMTGSSVYIAFQYVNGTSAASSSWSIDNLEVRGN
ncbi:MAG: choice-of-anchor J domain-containing protein [Cyclobacteriaceae bacterium]|nr:choice-of-anchor J domain-containing protein [Cyclobacteriaceae bacterium]